MNNDTFLHQLMTLPTVLDARLSPDKQWVAFTWYRRQEIVDVFRVPTIGSRSPIALTHTPEATELASWAPDSSAVIVSEDHDGDGFARLIRVDIAKPHQLLVFEDEGHGIGKPANQEKLYPQLAGFFEQAFGS